MRAGRHLSSALLAIVLATWGCVDLGSEPWPEERDTGTGTSTTSGLDAGGSGCPHPDGLPKQHQVEMINNTFRPNMLTICAGDSVLWRNRDPREHTVFSGTPEAPDGMIASDKVFLGGTFEYTFNSIGNFIYYCSTHWKVMRDAWIFVR